MPEDQGNPDAALSNEVVRALGQELRRLREEHAVVEERNNVLEAENTRLQRDLDDTRRALQAKARVKEEEPRVLPSGNDYDELKRALDESVQQREAEQAEHARVVEELRNKLARGKEKRAVLRAALSGTQEVDVKALLRCDELDVLDLSDLRGFKVGLGLAWVRIGKALNEPHYQECIWKCFNDDSLWTASKDFCVFLLPSHHYDTGDGSFKHNSHELLPRLGDTRDIFHKDSSHQWLYCGDFKCEWSYSVSLEDLDRFTRVAPDTLTRIKRTIVDRACSGGGPASRTAALKMLEDGLMTVGCYGLVKTGYKYQVDLAMEAYTRDSMKTRSQTRKRPSDDENNNWQKRHKRWSS
ncbi:hypothetical protein FOMPIDRAFT_1048030 [Fomitopsis schrenkii]|uniref:Uncharacterized protein n=1 Tax=Fomitopsis schrenkii TaxID=2126942 RepID=S8ECK5_FOMSC|nr:hypothetical protein FOMPIDRAFT_1048030 [Fomitopsis schrenkii]